jgi:hypothetical protein
MAQIEQHSKIAIGLRRGGNHSKSTATTAIDPIDQLDFFDDF